MTQYKSLYEKYLAELREKGKIRVLSDDVNMQIMQELKLEEPFKELMQNETGIVLIIKLTK